MLGGSGKEVYLPGLSRRLARIPVCQDIQGQASHGNGIRQHPLHGRYFPSGPRENHPPWLPQMVKRLPRLDPPTFMHPPEVEEARELLHLPAGNLPEHHPPVCRHGTRLRSPSPAEKRPAKLYYFRQELNYLQFFGVRGTVPANRKAFCLQIVSKVTYFLSKR